MDAGDGERAASVERSHRDRERVRPPVRRGSRRRASPAVRRWRLDRGGAEFQRQALRVRRSGHDVDGRALVHRHLRGEVRGGTEPVDPESSPSWQCASSQRPVPDDAGTQQRGGFDVRERVRHRIGIVLGHDRKFGVTTVRVPAGERRRHTEVLATAAGRMRTVRTWSAAMRCRLGRRRRSVSRRRPCSTTRPDDLVAGHGAQGGGVRGRPRPGGGRCGRRHTPTPVPVPRPARAPARLVHQTASGSLSIGPGRSTHHASTMPIFAPARRSGS